MHYFIYFKSTTVAISGIFRGIPIKGPVEPHFEKRQVIAILNYFHTLIENGYCSILLY